MREGWSPVASVRVRRVRIVALFLLLGMFALPLSNAHAQDKNGTNDPIEYVNRGILDFNLLVDRFFLKPVAQGYRFLFPDPVRKGLRNALRNLQAPTVLANDLLRGNSNVPQRPWGVSASIRPLVLSVFSMSPQAGGWNPMSRILGRRWLFGAFLTDPI